MQAFVADLMNEAVAGAEAAGLRPVLVVHDEMLIDAREPEALKRVMETRPHWASTFPLRAEVSLLPGRFLKG
jgi:hypothetical protein